VIFVTPVAFLLVGQAVVAAGEGLAVLGRRWNKQAIRRAGVLALTIPLVWIMAGRVHAYFVNNRQASRLEGTLAVVEHRAQPGDTIVVSPRFFVRPLDVPQVEVLYLNEHPSFEKLDALASQQGRMWILCTSYPVASGLQEPLDEWLQARPDQFICVLIKAVNGLAIETGSYTDAELELKERSATLEALAQDSVDRNELWQRYGLLADGYLELADLYAGRGEDALATRYRRQAEQVRAAHPRP
jgi:hypothetical protein